MNTVWVLDVSESDAQELVGAFPMGVYAVRVWTAASSMLEAVETGPPDLVVVEHGITSASAVDVLRCIKDVDRRLPVIVVAAETSTRGAIESMREGAYDYLPRDVLPGGLADVARRALSSSGAIRTMGSPGPSDVAELGAVVGQTPEMLEIHKLIGQVATTDAAVLIQGEPGTGKELAARAIHYNSERRGAPFVAVSCGALRGDLLDVELFGRGGGPGGDFDVGRFELADGGTIFLDEIDEIGPAAQGRILSILERGVFERPHTRSVVPVNVRVIAATNRSLVDRMKDGAFRVDLFYRLKVVTIFMPPLRDRQDDILCLAEHFVERANASMQRSVSGMSLEVIDLLKQYPWPGNVRELEQSIRRAVALNRTGVLAPDDFEMFRDGAHWPDVRGPTALDLSECVGGKFRDLKAAGEEDIDRAIVSEVEGILARDALRLSHGNQVRAARALGISRNTLRKRLRGSD